VLETIFLCDFVFFDDYLIVKYFEDIENLIDFRSIFLSKKPSCGIGQIVSEKVWKTPSSRGLAHGLSSITHDEMKIFNEIDLMTATK
jgi:hypothetical protein